MLHEYAAIDPMALLVPSRIYISMSEKLHPHVPKALEIKEAVGRLTPEERLYILQRARMMSTYSKAVQGGGRGDKVVGPCAVGFHEMPSGLTSSGREWLQTSASHCWQTPTAPRSSVKLRPTYVASCRVTTNRNAPRAHPGVTPKRSHGSNVRETR